MRPGSTWDSRNWADTGTSPNVWRPPRPRPRHKANKHWKSLLEKWRGALSSRDHTRRDDALAGLAAVADYELSRRSGSSSCWSQESQKTAVKLLGQIDAPGSSRALALLALMSQSAEVKREALQFLQKRDPRDYAAVLIALFAETRSSTTRKPLTSPVPGASFCEVEFGKCQLPVRPPLVAPSLPMLPNDSVSAR